MDNSVLNIYFDFNGNKSGSNTHNAANSKNNGINARTVIKDNINANNGENLENVIKNSINANNFTKNAKNDSINANFTNNVANNVKNSENMIKNGFNANITAKNAENDIKNGNFANNIGNHNNIIADSKLEESKDKEKDDMYDNVNEMKNDYDEKRYSENDNSDPRESMTFEEEFANMDITEIQKIKEFNISVINGSDLFDVNFKNSLLNTKQDPDICEF